MLSPCYGHGKARAVMHYCMARICFEDCNVFWRIITEKNNRLIHRKLQLITYNPIQNANIKK